MYIVADDGKLGRFDVDGTLNVEPAIYDSQAVHLGQMTYHNISDTNLTITATGSVTIKSKDNMKVIPPMGMFKIVKISNTIYHLYGDLITS